MQWVDNIKEWLYLGASEVEEFSGNKLGSHHSVLNMVESAWYFMARIHPLFKKCFQTLHMKE